MKILCEDENFYIKNTLSVSKALIGKKLIRTINGEKLIMEITETEAYMGIEDKASHAFNGKKNQ